MKVSNQFHKKKLYENEMVQNCFSLLIRGSNILIKRGITSHGTVPFILVHLRIFKMIFTLCVQYFFPNWIHSPAIREYSTVQRSIITFFLYRIKKYTVQGQRWLDCLSAVRESVSFDQYGNWFPWQYAEIEAMLSQKALSSRNCPRQRWIDGTIQGSTERQNYPRQHWIGGTIKDSAE